MLDSGAGAQAVHVVYLIGERGGGFVKIGWSAGRAEKRLAAMQVGNPHTLAVLAMAPVRDGPRTEKLLHEQFSKYRRRGEWFEVAGPLKHIKTNHELEKVVAFVTFNVGFPLGKMKQAVEGMAAEHAMYGRSRLREILDGMRLVSPLDYINMMGYVTGVEARSRAVR